MSRHSEGLARLRTLQFVVLFIFSMILIRLAWIQLFDPKYKDMARNNVLRQVVLYPARGEIYDRNGEFLAQSKECYDLMVIYRELPKSGFDTTRLCKLLDISRNKLERELASARQAPRAARRIVSYVPKETKLLLDEQKIPGFYMVYRTVRQYPRKVGGNLLGYVGEVSEQMLRRYENYEVGDYVGMTGVEAAYESVLKE